MYVSIYLSIYLSMHVCIFVYVYVCIYIYIYIWGCRGAVSKPPWRQPRGKLMVSLVNSHADATRIGWHLWKIDLRFAPGWLTESPPVRRHSVEGGVRAYIPDSVCKVVWQKSVPAQIRQLFLYTGNDEGHVDGFVGESTLIKRLHKQFL